MKQETVSQAASSGHIPRVWLITAYRAGEREQILALAEALGWPFEVKEIDHRKYAWRTNLLRGSDLSGINLAGSSRLEQPWPDLIISAGMRNEPVCRWIRQQSGGQAKIVHIGRPWADPRKFNLVITTPQYRLPKRSNVLQNTTTLHRITAERLQKAAAKCQAGLGFLRGPYIAVGIGGSSGPYTLGFKATKRLAIQASALAEKRKAALLITTSARTSAQVQETLEKWVRVPKQIYNWREDDPDNPYYGYLALADEIIVTADSISMLTEACATRKPVHMFDPGTGARSMRRNSSGKDDGNDFRLSAETYRLMMRFGPLRLGRDIRLVHDKLIRIGRVAWLGDKFPAVKLTELPDLARAVKCVHKLFGHKP